MAEFSTRKITPTDAVKIPAVNENLANPSGYMENDELKAYMTNGLATSDDVVAADTGIRGTADAYDDTNTPYAKGDPCIFQNVVYVCKEPISAPAGVFDPDKWDESSLATLMAGVNANADAITSLSSSGTYTPTVTSGASSSSSMGTQKFWIIGKLCYVSIDSTATFTGVTTSGFKCTLPFPSKCYAVGEVGYCGCFAMSSLTEIRDIHCAVGANSDELAFEFINSGGSVTALKLYGSGSLRCNIIYPIAD